MHRQLKLTPRSDKKSGYIQARFYYVTINYLFQRLLQEHLASLGVFTVFI